MLQRNCRKWDREQTGHTVQTHIRLFPKKVLPLHRNILGHYCSVKLNRYSIMTTIVFFLILFFQIFTMTLMEIVGSELKQELSLKKDKRRTVRRFISWD